MRSLQRGDCFSKGGELEFSFELRWIWAKSLLRRTAGSDRGRHPSACQQLSEEAHRERSLELPFYGLQSCGAGIPSHRADIDAASGREAVPKTHSLTGSGPKLL